MNKIKFGFPTKQKDILEDARNQRIAILLSEMWHAGSISRSRLGKITGLALPSVTRLVQDLKNANVIYSKGVINFYEKQFSELGKVLKIEKQHRRHQIAQMNALKETRQK